MPFAAGAQGIAQPVPASCLTFNNNLAWGSSDYYSGGAVTQLQLFLQTQGYFPYQPVGIFGPVTFSSVRSFQAAHGISATGFVGPLTRAAISRLSCGTTPVVPTSGPVTVYGISPAQAPTGSTITISGTGFTGSNIVLFDGLVAAQNVSSFNGQLTLSVPQSLSPNCAAGMACPMFVRLATPGTYQVSVQNSNGTSNSVAFTITSGAQNQTLSISGLNAPAQLALGQTGTWTVQVNTTTTQNLQYSVVWGDEAQRTNIMAPSSTQVQTSATFTHAYSQSGTYTPTFTVTDNQGHTVSTSATVTVTPLY